MKRVLAYSQLLRLPNVFTAMADVCMGFLISHGSPDPWPHFAALLVASSAIYLAGMVLNDWFDLEVDRLERPGRPLPSGRVPVRDALVLGVGLMILAGAIGLAVGGVSRNVTLLLIVGVLLYDGWAKQTLLGPFLMGLCRSLNVLLGMSDVPGAIWLPPVLGFHPPGAAPAWRLGTMAAAAIGLYVMGITRFARSEATRQARPAVLSVTLGFNLGLLLLAMIPDTLAAGNGGAAALAPAGALPHWMRAEWMAGRAAIPADHYYTAAGIWLAVALVTNGFVWRALADMEPAKVQQAVKACIVSIIGLDAAVVAFVNGPVPACAVLALIMPSLIFGRWVYST
jgi:4-hydroxybenzoate polyprenyltransferase